MDLFDNLINAIVIVILVLLLLGSGACVILDVGSMLAMLADIFTGNFIFGYFLMVLTATLVAGIVAAVCWYALKRMLKSFD